MKSFLKKVFLALFSSVLVFSSSVNANLIMNLYQCEDIGELKWEVSKIKPESGFSETEYRISCIVMRMIECVVPKIQVFWMSSLKVTSIIKSYIQVLDRCSSSQGEWKSEIVKYINDKKTNLELYELAALAGELQSEKSLNNMKVLVGGQNTVNFQDFNYALLHSIHDKLSNKPHNQSSDNVKVKMCLEEKSMMLKPLKYNFENLTSVCNESLISQLLSLEDHENIIVLENLKYPFLMANYPKELQPIFEYVASRNIKDTPQAIDLAAQLFNGLNVLHSKGVFYGGVSPFNILVDEDGILKLSNFNNSTTVSTVTGDFVKCDSLIGWEMKYAQEFVNRFLISSTSKIGIKYSQLLSAKLKSSSIMNCSAKAHLEILKSLKM